MALLRRTLAVARELKGRAVPAVRHLGYVTGASTLLARGQRALRIIKFQGVGDAEYPTRVFREQLLYLRRHFRVVPLSEVLARIETGAHHEVALTFDDGQRNNYTEVYPVLRELGLPATFFVCPGAIDGGSWIWTQEAGVRLDWLRASHAGAHRDLARGWGVAAATEAMLDWLKSLSTAERLRRMDELRDVSRAFVPDVEQRAYYDVMGWEDLRALDPQLITIGSHTISHPLLTSCTREEQIEEVRESRRWLERELGRPVPYFSYPCGAHDDGAVRLVSETYEAAVADTGLVRRGVDRFAVPRVPFALDLPLMAWRMSRPGS